MARPTSSDRCRCGHPHVAHQHYRRGEDCALCVCGRFRLGLPVAATAVRAPRPLRLPWRPAA